MNKIDVGHLNGALGCSDTNYTSLGLKTFENALLIIIYRCE